jgi:ribosomal protein S18 acetylase RimI-like enzyme
MCYVKRNFLRVFGIAACLFAAFSFSSQMFGMEKQEVEAKVESAQTDWMKYVNAAIGENKSGSFLTKDKLGNPVILEWEEIAPSEKSFSNYIYSFSDLIQRFSDSISQILIEINIDSVKKNYEKLYKKAKDPLKEVEKRMAEVEKKMENADFDLCKEEIREGCANAHCRNLNDILFFIKVKDKDAKEILGVALFTISNSRDYGNIYLDSLFFKPKAQKLGLGKLATSLIFKILPELKSISLDALVESENAIAAYLAMGFTKQSDFWSFLKPRKVYIAMEYKVEKSNKLQDAAKSLKLIK